LALILGVIWQQINCQFKNKLNILNTRKAKYTNKKPHCLEPNNCTIFYLHIVLHHFHHFPTLALLADHLQSVVCIVMYCG